jgi:hypothetical protein
MLNHEEIECSFRKISNFPNEGLKSGRYSGSYYWNIKDFGFKNWIVLCYIDVDWPTLLSEKHKSKEEIVSGCLNFLNKVSEKKKYSKKDPKPPFGFLESYKTDLVIKNNKPCIIAELKTSERTNGSFWCEGPSCIGTTIKRRSKSSKEEIEE